MTLGAGVEQLYVFAVFWALGIGLSLIFLFFEGLLQTRFAACIFDVLFGAFAIWVIWKVNLDVNNGEVRTFLYIALVLGCATTVLTCKTTLDKLSAMLYTWLTKGLAAQHEQNFLQKINVDSIRSGNADTGIAGVHAVGNADADEFAQTAGRKAERNDRRRKTRRAKASGAHRLSQNGRLRKRMGRKSQSHKQR